MTGVQTCALPILSADLQVDFKVVNQLVEDLLVTFRATDGVRQFHAVSMRALINRLLVEDLSVRFGVNYVMPAGCALRPTQRTHVRPRLEMRARIQR